MSSTLAIIEELSELLKPVQKKCREEFSLPNYPPLFIVGNPRSGTTLFLQWLASIGSFSYPTNLLTKFAYSPHIGALVQELLVKDRTGDLEAVPDGFVSDLGKSNGLLAPNEFYHFYRNYIDAYFPKYLTKEEVREVNFHAMLQDIASIEAVFDKPFASKGMLIQYNLLDFIKSNDNMVFVYIKRSPEQIMQSIYNARKKYFGNVNEWWSVKPKEYEQLISKDVFEQIAGQVYYTEVSLNDQFDELDNKNKLIIEYDQLCNDPASIYEMLQKKYKEFGVELAIPSSLTYEFKVSDKMKIDKNDYHKMLDAYNRLKNNG